MRWFGLLVVVSGSVGCARANPLFDDTEGAGTESGVSASSPGPTSGPSTADSGLPTDPTDPKSTGDSGSSMEGEATFDPDSGPDTIGETGIGATTGGVCARWGEECAPTMPTAKQCLPGEKCAPTGDDSGYTGGHCVVVDQNASLDGVACTIECHDHSGIDSCGAGLLCVGTDGEGRCVPLCLRDPATGTLSCGETSTHVCAVEADGLYGLCRPACNPLLGCDDADVCVPDAIGDGWHCEPDGSGDGGAQGDPCEELDECDPGLTCVEPSSVPGCIGASGCCTEVCELGTLSCPAGMACVAYYEGADAPPGFEDVGVCVGS